MLTSPCRSGFSALAGVAAHARAGRVRLGPGITFGLVGAAGSVIGAKASSLADPNVLLLWFAGLMVAAAVAMFRRSRRRDTECPPTGDGGVATLTPAALSR